MLQLLSYADAVRPPTLTVAPAPTLTYVPQ